MHRACRISNPYRVSRDVCQRHKERRVSRSPGPRTLLNSLFASGIRLPTKSGPINAIHSKESPHRQNPIALAIGHIIVRRRKTDKGVCLGNLCLDDFTLVLSISEFNTRQRCSLLLSTDTRHVPRGLRVPRYSDIVKFMDAFEADEMYSTILSATLVKSSQAIGGFHAYHSSSELRQKICSEVGS